MRMFPLQLFKPPFQVRLIWQLACDMPDKRHKTFTVRNAMRYVYGAVAFVGVVVLVFACLVALQRMVG